jgi:hypothetical protein
MRYRFGNIGIKSRNVMMKYFEDYLKREFSGCEDEEFNCLIPGVKNDPSIGIEAGFLTLTGEEVEIIFEPIIKEITDLVQWQIRALEKTGMEKLSVCQ